MSATQSHTELENLFPFDPSQHVLPMSGRSDLLRQGMPQLPPNMLALNSSQFLPSQQQPGQPQQPQNSMSLLQNPGNPPQPIAAMLGGQTAGSSALAAQQRYQMQLNTTNSSQRNQVLMHPRNAQAMATAASNAVQGTHINAMSHSQLQGMPFMMPQGANNQQVRRVTSQSQGLNQLNALHASQQALGGLAMGMNAQTSMPGQIRQATQHQQQQALRLQSQQMQIPSEMQMAIRQGANPMPQTMTRSASAQAQLMGSLTHPQSGLTPGHQGLQSGHPQNNFPTSISLPQQHPAPQTSSSPRPGSHPPPRTIGTPGPTHGGVNRSQMPSENSMFMNFSNPQFSQMSHGAARISSNSAPFSFVPSSTPPGQHGPDLSGYRDHAGDLRECLPDDFRRAADT